MNEYDVLIIGAGPTGYSSALSLAGKGFSVCLVEKNNVGGVCLNSGCIPTKVLVAAAKRLHEVSLFSKYGLSVEKLTFDYSIFKVNQTGVISRLTKGLEFSLKKAGVEIIKGTAKIIDDKTVSVDDKIFSFKNLILATGSSPFMPKDWQNIKNVVDAQAFWGIDNIPNEIVIVGAGVIGCEYAGSLALLGYKITLIEKMDRILITEEEEVSKTIHSNLEKYGVKILTGVNITNIKNIDEKVIVGLENQEDIMSGLAIISVGRKRNVDEEILKRIGVDDIAQYTKNNPYKISDNIFVGGDVSFGPQLAHKGYYDADKIVDMIVNKKDAVCDYENIPMTIYTIPEVSRVGFTERDAKQKYKNIKSLTMQFASIGKAVVENNTRGFIKIIVDIDTNKVLGITILGNEATELHGYSLLIIQNNMTAQDVAHTYFGHPTLGEIFKHVAEHV